MKQLVIFITSALVTCSLLTGFRALPILASIPVGEAGSPNPRPIDRGGLSCAMPRPDQLTKCKELERQILASTVRLDWHLWTQEEDGRGYTYVAGSRGLATIKEGRYLVTHNHLDISLSELEDGKLITVSVFAANGKPLWLEAPLKMLTITAEDAETLVLDFGSFGDQGLFSTMFLSSAEFRTWASLPLQPGMEVAQIDWDGTTAQVDWVTIEEIITGDGTPRLELANVVAPGASGGGVFWNGYHIANTWSQVTAYDGKSGAVLRQFSVAALNSPQVTAARQEVQSDELKHFKQITRDSG